jgi:hypothetical protein
MTNAMKEHARDLPEPAMMGDPVLRILVMKILTAVSMIQPAALVPQILNAMTSTYVQITSAIQQQDNATHHHTTIIHVMMAYTVQLETHVVKENALEQEGAAMISYHAQ